MTRSAVFVACVGAFCLGITPRASAEPVTITITGGSLVFPTGERFQLGPISLTGTHGFSVEGFVNPDEVQNLPVLGFGWAPGSTFTPATIQTSAWADTTLTLEGQTFPNVGFSLTLLSLKVMTPLTVPELQPSPVTVKAPFTTIGLVARGDPDLPPLEAFIQGSGTVTAMFSEDPAGFWNSEGVRYDFTQPTPEPATLTLMSGGLVAAAIRARKRRDRRTSIQLSTSTPTV